MTRLDRAPTFTFAGPADLEVELHTRLGTVELGGGAADVGLLYGNGHWSELVSHRLLELRACIVCAPPLRAALPPSASWQELTRHRLLEPLLPPRLWETWSALAGVPVPATQPRVRFDSMQVMYEAATRGLGLAIGVRPLVNPYLARGQLVPAWPGVVQMPGAYHVAALPYMRRKAPIRRFWQWLVQEAEATTTEAT